MVVAHYWRLGAGEDRDILLQNREINVKKYFSSYLCCGRIFHPTNLFPASGFYLDFGQRTLHTQKFDPSLIRRSLLLAHQHEAFDVLGCSVACLWILGVWWTT